MDVLNDANDLVPQRWSGPPRNRLPDVLAQRRGGGAPLFSSEVLGDDRDSRAAGRCRST